MTEELKPCPFCGGNAYLNCYKGTNYWWEVSCTLCGASVSSPKIFFPYNKEARNEAIKKWNRRVTDADSD